jgi:hypothetical protein
MGTVPVGKYGLLYRCRRRRSDRMRVLETLQVNAERTGALALEHVQRARKRACGLRGE